MKFILVQTKWSQTGYMSALINQKGLESSRKDTWRKRPTPPWEFQPLLRYIPSPGALYITYIKCMKSTFIYIYIYIYMHKLSCYIDLAIWVVLLINNKLPVLVKLSKIYWCVRSIAFTTLSAYHLWIFFFFFNKMNCRLFELGISWEVVQLKLKGHRRCLDGLKVWSFRGYRIQFYMQRRCCVTDIFWFWAPHESLSIRCGEKVMVYNL